MLGPLLVEDTTGPRTVAAPRLRAILAALLLHANRPVSAADLADQVWNLEPPASATGTLHSYLSRLRTAMGPLGERIQTRSSGYAIDVAPGELDLTMFTTLCDRARAALEQGDLEAAADAYTYALAVWRGAPLADIPDGPWVADAARYWDEQELLTREELHDVELKLGRQAVAIPRLQVLTSENPFRERLAALLLTALAQDGRKAEALSEYRRIRDLMVEETGVEPGGVLKAAFQEILREDEEAAPHQLPPGIVDFTGRDDQLSKLSEVLTGATAGAPPAVAVVSGPGGIRKTTFAVQLAHRLRAEFPDGQIFASLGGLRAPRRLAELDGEILRALGVAAHEIPGDAERRAALLRSWLADRRVLLVLDDATDAAQIRRLLPASGPSAVVVTSRRRLTGLTGRIQFELVALTDDEAAALLARIIGADRGRARSRPGTDRGMWRPADRGPDLRGAPGLTAQPQHRLARGPAEGEPPRRPRHRRHRGASHPG